MNEFGTLLRTSRRDSTDPDRGGSLTQERLAELLEQQAGLPNYTGTRVSNWERGEEIIRHDNRVLLNGIIQILHHCGGVPTLEKANELLFAGGYRHLSDAEIQQINPAWTVSHVSARPPDNSLFSLGTLQEWLETIFHWSQADAHARSSWAGKVIWGTRAVTDRLTPYGFLIFSVVTLLWVVTAWLITPILQWPMADETARWNACIQYAVASLLIPLAVTILTEPDDHFLIHTRKDALVRLGLKFTGASVGFGCFSALLLGAAMVWYYLTASSLPHLVAGVATIIPLLWSHIAARRIPADRYKMYGEIPQTHPADKLFLGVFLFFGAFLAGFVYRWHWFLADRVMGVGMLLLLTSIALWEYQKHYALPHYQIILLLGVGLPLAFVGLFFFVSPQTGLGGAGTWKDLGNIALVSAYVVGASALWVTLRVRKRPIWMYGSLLLLFGATGFSLSLEIQHLVSLWANTVGFIVLAYFLIWWVYQSAK